MLRLLHKPLIFYTILTFCPIPHPSLTPCSDVPRSLPVWIYPGRPWASSHQRWVSWPRRWLPNLQVSSFRDRRSTSFPRTIVSTPFSFTLLLTLSSSKIRRFTFHLYSPGPSGSAPTLEGTSTSLEPVLDKDRTDPSSTSLDPVPRVEKDGRELKCRPTTSGRLFLVVFPGVGQGSVRTKTYPLRGNVKIYLIPTSTTFIWPKFRRIELMIEALGPFNELEIEETEVKSVRILPQNGRGILYRHS